MWTGLLSAGGWAFVSSMAPSRGCWRETAGPYHVGSKTQKEEDGFLSPKYPRTQYTM